MTRVLSLAGRLVLAIAGAAAFAGFAATVATVLPFGLAVLMGKA